MLKILTLNINYYGSKHGAWQDRRDIICRTIQSAQPDIVALQAVAADPAIEGGLDQASQLSQLLPGYIHVHFRPVPDGGEQVAHGSAFLSRLPIAEVKSLPLSLLPDLEDANQRVLLAGRFDLAAGPLYLFNGHFSWVPEQAHLNVEQALPFISSFSEGALFVGDLNQTPGSATMQAIHSAGWSDIWSELHPETQGYTFESNSPTSRIDYGWANPLLRPRVRDIQVVAQEANGQGARASDHRGLLVILDVNR